MDVIFLIALRIWLRSTTVYDMDMHADVCEERVGERRREHACTWS